MAAYGLYSHIQSNKRRSVALLISLFLLVYVLVYAGAALGEALGTNAPLDIILRRAVNDTIAALPWATVGTVLWIIIAYKFHQSMIDALTGGREVTRQQEPRLYNLLENLCISRGITMPKLKIADDPALNAFATGMNEQQYAITVTSGLLARLDDAELESVLGHDLVLRRARLPPVLPGRARLPARRRRSQGRRRRDRRDPHRGCAHHRGLG